MTPNDYLRQIVRTKQYKHIGVILEFRSEATSQGSITKYQVNYISPRTEEPECNYNYFTEKEFDILTPEQIQDLVTKDIEQELQTYKETWKQRLKEYSNFNLK